MNKKNKTPQNAVRANKKLGQHFLTDTGIIARIVDAIDPDQGQHLLEIGPGLGAITLPVLERCRHLHAIELDRRVIPILQEKAQALGQLDIIEQDVLTLDFPTLLGEYDWRVFGNLPYNISTPILFALSAQPNITDMVFMLQKEVVDRMVALPSEKHYGRLSVMLSYHHDVYPLFDVPPDSFSPPPKVMSAMVGLTRLDKPRWDVADEAAFAAVVKQAFAMRRKTLRNTLKPFISGEDLLSLDIDPSQRAEVLDGEVFARIANYLHDRDFFAINSLE
ncbi:MAG: 16S rRNA (adenine(1518)-N(6)/adenine(1519)-N(6))-dimethyltransferase [Gammaproteobacteria bacterium]|nr:MAG: 16S rRNA (adenine(1518)-N(6)/adenine(1519)-N(6))-dimethyltransferase [Gammaproteobacteria bacterium]